MLVIAVVVAFCMTQMSMATHPSHPSHHGHVPPTSPTLPPPIIIVKPPTEHPPVIKPTEGTCPVPTNEQLRCMRQWACQYIIRLDLRCLLNLNGNPLLGNLLGGSSPAAGAPAAGGGNGGLLGGILGL